MLPFLQQVAADLLSRFGDELKDVAVVLTNKRPIVFLRKHLADLVGKPLWSPSFFTIQEFLRQSSALPEASPLTQFFILHRLHNDLLREEGRPEETPDEFYPLAETILSDFAQLDYDLVVPEAVYTELRDIALLQQRFPHLSAEQQKFMRQFWESFSVGKQTAIQQKFLQLWGRLPVLYQRFKDELTRQKLTTTAGVYRDLAEGRASNPGFIDHYRATIFVGFNALSQSEVKLFKHWQESGKALFYFDADAYYLEDNLQEAGLFLRRNLRQYGLKNALGEVPTVLSNKTGRVTLMATSGRVAQAKVLANVLADKPEERAVPSNTAIILADESLLIPVLQSLPESIEFNITMGYPLMQSTLFGFIDLWLSIQQQLGVNSRFTVHHQDVKAVITHPLSGIPANERETLLEKIATHEWLEVPAAELQLVTASYPHFFKPQSGNRRVLQALHELLDGVLEYRGRTHQLHHLEAVLIVAVKKALNFLEEGLTHQPDLQISFLTALIRKALLRVSAPIEGEPLKGIQIMGLLESRCLDFDEVYILGANEGTLPNTSLAPSFIPDSVRRGHGLPVLENQDALSAYLFYRLLQFPKRITVVYNAVVDDSNSGEVSRFVRQLAFESRFSLEQCTQHQPIRTIAPSEPLEIPKTGEVWNKLMKYVEGDNPGRPKLSASALTTYLQSPLLFFLKYVAGIKEPPRVTEEFEMNRLGTVVHLAMQDVYEALKAADELITADRIRKKIRELPEICLRALSNVIYEDAAVLRTPNSMQRILLKVAEEYTSVFLNYDATHVAPLRIVELENDRDYVFPFPITVQGTPRTITLYGIIDRVDEVNGKTRIVDYKTGRDEVKYQGFETLFAPLSDKGNKAMIQTLFYTYVYEQVSGRRAVEPNLYVARRLRSEGPLFYRSGRGKFPAEGAELEEIKTHFVTFLRQTLEELFNPEIPFRHNPEAPAYPGDPYREFLNQIQEEADDEN